MATNDLIRCSDMLDSMPFDVYAVDLQTDKLVYANKNLMNRHIIEKDMPCYKAINGRDSKCLFCRRDELLDKNGAPNGNMLTYEHFNEADDRWYQMQERAIVWDDGKIVKYVIAVDISELKSVQNSLAEAHAALAIKNKELELAHIQMAKQAQLGELLDMIAHQWKQPISAISILFDELKLLQTLKQIDDESILKICSEGRKTIGTINKTLNEFRSFFDPSNEKTTFDTVVAIKNTMELISKKLSYDNIAMEIQTNTDNTNAYGIASEFSQVVLAIVTNGVEAIVSKRARDLLEKKDYIGVVRIEVRSDGDTLNIAFLDNGVGINDDLSMRIFNNRFTTKKDTGGTGVGLSMAKLIIEEKMNGKITAADTGSGALISISLPIIKSL